jgi:phosphatidylinositol alpha-1,6-mannosyltransferase
VRLGLFLNLPMHEVDGQYTARYPHLFDFFLSLGDITAETTLLLPLKHGGARNPEYGDVMIPPGVRIVGLPHWSSARMLVRRFHRVAPATVMIFARYLGRVDIIGAVAPSAVGTILLTLARLRRRPVFLLVRGEKQRTVRWIMGDRKARPYVAALKLMEAAVRHWIRAGVPAFVAGQELVERYAAPGARLYDLYPALSRDFPLASQPRPATGGRDAEHRLITVARLSGEKGIDDLLRALALLRDEGLPVRLEIVGDGPLRAELGALAGELGLTDHVNFAGFVPHGPKLIAALDGSDVFVLPSRSEGLPHSVVEAMARAVPVVATEVGGLPAFLGNGNGVLVPIGDPVALARGIAGVLRDPGRRAQLSERALSTALRVHPDTQLTAFCTHLADAYPQVAQPPADIVSAEGGLTEQDDARA